MTKKQFIALAAALAEVRPDRGNAYAPASVKAKGAAAFAQWRATVDAVAATCAAQAKNGFDRARFLAACGVEGA